MREIKFRGFDQITKKFIYGNLLFTNETYYIIPFLTNGCMSQKEMMLRWISPCFQVVSGTVGQFTGLHDKNGVEIYEGDIVEVYEPFNIPQVAKVKFNDGCFDVIGITLTFRDYLKCFVANNAIEVIGNIHEKEQTQ